MSRADGFIRRWGLPALYALLTVSAVALGTLLLGDVVAALEAGEHAEGAAGGFELHHLFIFDLAWPVFLVTAPATLVAGIGALFASRVRHAPGMGRYAAWALGYAAVAIGLLFAVGGLEL